MFFDRIDTKRLPVILNGEKAYVEINGMRYQAGVLSIADFTYITLGGDKFLLEEDKKLRFQDNISITSQEEKKIINKLNIFKILWLPLTTSQPQDKSSPHISQSQAVRKNEVP